MLDQGRRPFQAGVFFQRYMRNFFSRFMIWIGISTFCGMIIGLLWAIIELGFGWPISVVVSSEDVTVDLQSGQPSVRLLLLVYSYAGLLFAHSYLTQSACCAAALAMRKGEVVTLGSTIALGFRKLLPVLGVSLVVTIAAAFSCCFAPVVLTIWAAAIPGVVLEGRSIGGALHRSAWLTKGQRIQVFLALLLILITFIPGSFATNVMSTLAPSVQFPITIAGALINSALQGVGLITIFLDLVESKEGHADPSEIF